jgi:hypothetical protein
MIVDACADNCIEIASATRTMRAGASRRENRGETFMVRVLVFIGLFAGLCRNPHVVWFGFDFEVMIAFPLQRDCAGGAARNRNFSRGLSLSRDSVTPLT